MYSFSPWLPCFIHTLTACEREVLPVKSVQGKYLSYLIFQVFRLNWSLSLLGGTPKYLNLALVAANNAWQKRGSPFNIIIFIKYLQHELTAALLINDSVNRSP